MQTIDKFVATAPRALKAADNDNGSKREFLRKLGVGAEIGHENTSKYVDWSIFAPDNLSVRAPYQRSVSGEI